MPAAGPELLGRLLDAHGAALTLYARQWCGTPEDVVQEAFVQLARQSCLPDQAVAWLYRVVRNTAISAARSDSRRRRHEAAAAAPSSSRSRMGPRRPHSPSRAICGGKVSGFAAIPRRAAPSINGPGADVMTFSFQDGRACRTRDFERRVVRRRGVHRRSRHKVIRLTRGCCHRREVGTGRDDVGAHTGGSQRTQDRRENAEIGT